MHANRGPNDELICTVQVAKNITLAGVGSVTLVAKEAARPLLGKNFLITTAAEEHET